MAATVLVLGASGFIGRHAVAAIAQLGGRVVIGSRRPGGIGDRLPASARGSVRREVHFERLLAACDWHPTLEGVDVVLNCVGILRQRGKETYERIHCLAPAALAGACRERGLPLIHVSALGLDPGARSGFLRSKLDGERALRASGADCWIVRPSLLDGDGGYGARWLRRVARWPVHPLPADAAGRIAALDVRDLGESLARLAIRVAAKEGAALERELELGGPEPCTLAVHLAALRRRYTPRPAYRLPIPALVARATSHICDVLRATPFSFGHWELLRRDNCPRRNALPALLGRPPRAVGVGPPTNPVAGTVTDFLSKESGFGIS